MSEAWEEHTDSDNRDDLPDQKEVEARQALNKFFNEHSNKVFYSNQVSVIHEDNYFHWLSNRALRNLLELESIRGEVRETTTGTTIKTYWNKKYRYYKKSANQLISLVEDFSNHEVGKTLGQYGEDIILKAFARCEFVLKGEQTRTFQGKAWTATEHNLDFIFEKDSITYGMEVKNTLSYIEKREFDFKLELCQSLSLRPVFAVRMMPKTWIYELYKAGGYAIILHYQMYPQHLKTLAERIAEELLLPTSYPRNLEQGTMQKFLNYHIKNVNSLP